MSSAPNIELGEPKTQEEWAEYYRLRYERLRKPLGQLLGSERDDPAEPSSIHIIAKMDGRVVGAGCWLVGLMFVRFRQMAVDSDCGGDSRDARSEKGGYMRRHGWIEQGEGVTLFGSVESISMVKRLS
jgi:hypothetical protein